LKMKKEEVKGRGTVTGLIEKRIWFFLLKFMVVSVAFLVVWFYIGELYQGAVCFVARYILLALGYTPLQISAVSLPRAYLVNFNLVPLVSLAIATPGWNLRTRCELLLLGLPVLFLLHVVDLVAHFPLYFYGSGIAQIVVQSIGVGGVATPFIIWIAFVFFLRRDVSSPHSIFYRIPHGKQ
jgi:hypothetical protein